MDYLKIFIPLIGVILAWLFNERGKRTWEEYKRKETNYKLLLSTLKGFYRSNKDTDEAKELRNEFILQLNLCWLYCPDEVIRKGYLFLDTVNTNKKCSDEEKENLLGDFILEIRKDLLKRKFTHKTELSNKEYKILAST
jgi:hypothetical protein